MREGRISGKRDGMRGEEGKRSFLRQRSVADCRRPESVARVSTEVRTVEEQPREEAKEGTGRDQSRPQSTTGLAVLLHGDESRKRERGECPWYSNSAAGFGIYAFGLPGRYVRDLGTA
jgi:hypothetical protein